MGAIPQGPDFEHLFADLVRHAPVCLFWADAGGACTFVNDRGLAFTGLSLDACRSEGWSQAVHPDDRARVLAAWRDAMARGEPLDVEFTSVGVDQDSRSTVARTVPVRDGAGVLVGFAGVIIDVSESRDASRVLQDTERLLASATEAVADAIFTVEYPARRILYANRAVTDVFGYDVAEVLGRSTRLLYADDATFEAYGRDLASALERGARRFGMLCRLVTKAGEEVWGEISTSVMSREPPMTLISVVRDVTDRQRAVEALRESERRVTTLMANVPGMVYRCRNDRDWSMEFGSDGCRELTGYAPDELTLDGRITYASLIHSEDRERIWNEVQEAVAGRKLFRLSYRITTAQGEERWVWEQGAGVFGPDGALQALEGLIMDVTERRRLGEQLRQAQKMEAIGQLAGGVAHDFNNLLTVILGYSELVLDSLDAGDARQADVREVLQAGRNAAALTQQLLAFSRRQILAPTVFDMNRVAESVAKMLGRVIGEHVRLATRLAPAPAFVKADAGQIEQILVNLAVNARDAMPEGGVLTIATDTADVVGPTAERAGIEPGRYVRLTMTDTGTGMDEATQARIFEPFFTTKEQGKGTGLGLATVYGIVRQSGGGIWVESEVGRGTVFTICFPSAGGAEPEPKAPPAASAARGRDEVIALVEDDPGVRSFAAAVLRRQGYTVIEAENGNRALARLSDRATPVDLLITDVVMPDMSGRRLAEQVAAAGLSARVLYMSGYTANAIVHHGMLDEGLDFLPKPFSADALTTKVREVLDR